MPTIHVEAEVSRESLLKAIEQLSPPELDQLVTEVLTLQSRRGTARLTTSESRLLTLINEGLPQELRRRYDELITRRRDEILTPEEHDELVRLTGDVERLEADRLEALAELARMRGVRLSVLMDDLGIPAPSDG